MTTHVPEASLTFRNNLACLFFFMGCCAANSIGGYGQAVFYIFSLVLIFLRGKVFYPKRSRVALFFLLFFLLLSNGWDNSAGVIRVIIESFIIANVLIYTFRVNKYKELLLLLKSLILFQAVFAIIMFCFPQIRESLLSYIYEGVAYQGEAFKNAIIYRGFGVSKHHLYGLPLAIALCVALIITERYEKPTVKVFYFILGVLLISLNARVGLAVLLLALFWMLVTCSKNNIKHLFLLFVITSISLFLFFGLFSFSDNATLDWLKEGVNQFSNSSNNQATTLSDLEGMIHIPTSSWDVLFGRSYSCNAESDCYSDIGFVRLINSGGLVSLCAIIFLYFYISCSLYDKGEWNYSVSRCMLVFFIFFVAMLKGEAYSASDYSRVFMVTCLVIMRIKKENASNVASSC
ncbi:hypothetical protein NRZ30_06435 [Aeromonas jandaei]|uniref:hypothetical protein n=1 Tax=Aeromonas jandaei TaxID=650 RepID=UPI00227A02CC|nr:hypothetical protein [Aeromonas jandaei]WAG08694.1 hypothetical protein NRZ30_06435 [Aeromonas jandaei]